MIIINQKELDYDLLEIFQNICEEVEGLASNLDISGFNGIRFVDDDNLHESSDGRFELDDMTIMLPKHKYKMYLRKNKYDVIKSTLYHELCHIDLFNKYPSLTKLYKDSFEKDNYCIAYTLIVFFEYFAHIMSSKYETTETKVNYYKSINAKEWDFRSEEDKILFIKSVPYILGRDKSNFYLNQFDDKELVERILIFKKLLDRIDRYKDYDSYFYLKDLEKEIIPYIDD